MTQQFKQLKAILWKNYLVKVAHPISTTAEILLPVLFMALLILIKSITSKYDSPNIAYYCGNIVSYLNYCYICVYMFSQYSIPGIITLPSTTPIS